MFYFRKDICKGTFSGIPRVTLGYTKPLKLPSPPPPALAGGNAVVDGCGRAQNSPELATEEYALMSIDTIINGKVGVL